jgi:hypothetical protein
MIEFVKENIFKEYGSRKLIIEQIVSGAISLKKSNSKTLIY